MLQSREAFKDEDLENNVKSKSNEYIKMSNELIDASYKLGVTEHRLYSFLLSKIKKNDPNWNVVSINIRDFADKFDIEHHAIYNEVKKAAAKLQKTQIFIKLDCENKSSSGEPYLIVSWLSSAEYREGVLEAEFSKKLEPYLINLKKNFTKCYMQEIGKFSSNYSIRLYQMLKRYSEYDHNIKEITIDEFRFILALENKYPKFSNLKIRVINQALKEINEKSDIKVDMSPVKRGKKVVGIKFVVEPKISKQNKSNKGKDKEPNKNVTADKTLLVTVHTLLGTVMPDAKEEDVLILLEDAGNDINKIMKQIMNVQLSKSKITNVMGYLRSAIRADYEIIPLEYQNRNKNYTDNSDQEDWEALADKTSKYY